MTVDPLAAFAALDSFAEVWAIDFEFYAPPGERPEVLCMVAHELRSGRTLRLWADELCALAGPPFPLGPQTLYVAYYASAELSCHLALGWPMPARVLDLFTEFSCHTSALETPCGRGLLGALAYYGLPALDAAEKESMRALALRGGEYTHRERADLLDYCEEDVAALARLLPAMLPKIDLPRALLRGRYMAAVARMEWVGVPIDMAILDALRSKWDMIKGRLVAEVDAKYGVYVEHAGGHSFSTQRFAGWLAGQNIPWPQLPSGALALDDETFQSMAKAYPAVSSLRDLRHSLSGLRLNDLAVGKDGRNRCLLSAFRSTSGRNQPSNSKFIFGPSTWLRGLIKPAPGRAIAYLDYEQQEFGVAAALSGDTNMLAAYRSGDPYLAFAKQAGAVPADATKQSHKAERERFKQCVLGVQYGMGAISLALRLGLSPAHGQELLEQYRQTYPRYWAWSQAAVDHAMLYGWLQTAFGWRVHVGPQANPRSLANFPMQANGAEILRLACCLATERGINVCAPVHDALTIEAANNEIEAAVAACDAAMREASAIVLDGFELRTEARIVRYPDRYMDDRGREMWDTVMQKLAECGRDEVE